jgi:hypothetical protein
MRKASTSFLILIFAALFVSLNSHAQGERGRGQGWGHGRGPRGDDFNSQIPGQQTLREIVNQNLRSYERLRLADLLRLSFSEARELEVRSLNLSARSLGLGHVRLELLQNGRPIDTQFLSRHSGEVFFLIPSGPRVEELELTASSEMFLSTVTAEVSSSRIPGPNPTPGYEQTVSAFSTLSLPLNQSVRGSALISLDQLIRQQLRLNLEGAEIEQISILGQSFGYGRTATVQVELNNRPASDVRYFSGISRLETIDLFSREEARSLALVVSGDALISEVRVRIGRVRSRFPEMPRTQRFIVGQVVSPRFPLELSSIIGFQPRRIRSVTIEARALNPMQVQLSLLTSFGESQGALFVSPNFIRGTLPLRRPFLSQELRLEAHSSVRIDAIEIEFESSSRF